MKVVFFKWSEAAVASLCGGPHNAVVYVPGKGSYPLLKGSKLGEKMNSDRADRVKRVYDTIARVMPDGSCIAIGKTNCERSVQSAVNEMLKEEVLA